MLVDIIDDQAYLASGQEKLLHEVIEAAAKYLNLPEGIELDLSIVSNEEIQVLNRDYRGLDKPTDVLSFALTEVTSEFDVDFAHLDLTEEAEETEDLEETEFEDEEAIPMASKPPTKGAVPRECSIFVSRTLIIYLVTPVMGYCLPSIKTTTG